MFDGILHSRRAIGIHYVARVEALPYVRSMPCLSFLTSVTVNIVATLKG
jgi:hypothetical protein